MLYLQVEQPLRFDAQVFSRLGDFDLEERFPAVQTPFFGAYAESIFGSTKPASSQASGDDYQIFFFSRMIVGIQMHVSQCTLISGIWRK